jgi:hypothetical protein
VKTDSFPLNGKGKIPSTPAEMTVSISHYTFERSSMEQYAILSQQFARLLGWLAACWQN